MLKCYVNKYWIFENKYTLECRAEHENICFTGLLFVIDNDGELIRTTNSLYSVKNVIY